ncbi:MAG: SDR family oxidoreductase [Cellvibrionaceae bacterium]|nr:SDR family oxidoreductase [Cellvibrionaceae bacterium]
MSKRLEGKVAFITGANSGIGLSIAQNFVAEGATVAILARSQKKADDAKSEIGSNTFAIIGDVTQLNSLQSAYKSINEKFGRLDIVVANAGIFEKNTLDNPATPEAFDRISDVNFKGAFYTVQYAVPFLSCGASIILTGSSVSEMGLGSNSLYSATKAAVRSLARALTPELAKKGIRINTLSPGPVLTPVLENSMTNEEIDELNTFYSENLPAGRIGQSIDLANAAVFLASDESSFTYGSDFQIDGGMNQTRWPMKYSL